MDPSLYIWRGAAFVAIPDPAQILPGGSQPWYLVDALMRVDRQSGSTGSCVCSLTAIGEPLQPTTYAGLVNQQGAQVLLPVETGTSDFAFDVKAWVAPRQGAGGAWYGFVGDENVSHGSNLHMLGGPSGNGISVEYFFFRSSDPTELASPSGTISTTTPTLTAQLVEPPDPDGAFDTVYYRFKISTEPSGAGAVIDSGWIVSPSWPVPAGALADGVTYHVRVWNHIGIPWGEPNAFGYYPAAEPTVVKALTIKKRLGGGGPSPTDTVGSVPGATSTPSKGAPSPGTGTASVTVNMTTGNLAATVNTHSLSSLSGPAGVTLSYDSMGATGLDGGSRGLFGRYSSGGSLIGRRVDPAIDFSWAGSPMGGIASANAEVNAEWNGTINVPAAQGSWQLGGTVANGTMTIYLDGSPSAYQAITANTPTFGSSLGSWSPGSSHSIRVTYTSSGTKGVQLWARDTGANPATGPEKFVVPTSWLAPRVTGLPAGWRLSANPYSGSWTRLDDFGSQAVLHSAGGATVTFTRRTDGSYAAPVGSNDLLTVAKTTVPGLLTAGEFSLSTSDNFLFVFDSDGWVRSVKSVADDRKPTALQYTYTTVSGAVGAPVLSSITDPVTNRSITLCHGPSCSGGAGSTPMGMLSTISYWDGPNRTRLEYNTNGQLARVVNPGGATADFGYDAAGLVSRIRDPLAYDVPAAGLSSYCQNDWLGVPACETYITYHVAFANKGKVLSVYSPAPVVGGQRPRRIYAYPPGTKTAKVDVEGFTPASGYASWVEWDDQGRLIEQKDSVGRLTKTTWDPYVERPLRSINPAGLQTTNVYDSFTNLLTDRYGPAPSSCFSTTFPYTPAGSCAVTVPRTQHRYDEGINNLAATFWDNPWFAGTPVQHSSGPGGTGPSGPGCSADTFCTQWNTLPVTPSGITRPSCCAWTTGSPFTWSMRLTGILTLPTPMSLETSTTQRAIIYIDGALYSDVDAPVANEDYAGNYGEWWAGPWPDPPMIPAGQHRIQIDFLGSSTTLNGLYLPGSGGVGPFMPNSWLRPDYGLETTTIDPDAKTVATSYTDTTAGIGPELGLVTAVTQDPGGLALVSKTSYESPASGRWLRRTATTLPAGTTTSFTHYCSTAGTIPADCDSGFTGAIATACDVTQGASQWGLLAQQTDPAPNPTTPARVQQYLHDSAGRTVGRRAGPADNIATAPWECTTFDARGRVASQTWPMLGTGLPGRVVTYTYQVGGNPLTASVADPNGTITATVDLHGRPVSYTDATGRTTSYIYDQVGRVTSTTGPQSGTLNTYDANSGQLTTMQITGQVTADATVAYDSAGRMSTVSYNGGQMTMSTLYDDYGNQRMVSFDDDTIPAPTRVAGHAVTRSPGGRQINTFIDTGGPTLVDPNPAGDDFVYDGAGRLTTALLLGGRADYNYGAPIGNNCMGVPGVNLDAGHNTNRTNVTWTPTTGSGTTTHSCYNNAD